MAPDACSAVHANTGMRMHTYTYTQARIVRDGGDEKEVLFVDRVPVLCG